MDADEGFILEDDNSRLPTKSGRVLGTFGRQNRLKGECLPAYHKRVSAILDKDDQLIMDMREQGFSDRAIAEKLAKIGGIRYDQKSIGTRIMRIRLAQAANVDFLLDEGYKEWEIEDVSECICSFFNLQCVVTSTQDNNLMKAFAIADIETNYEIERVRAWRFRKVSEYMRRFNKDSLFSVAACRERYKTLAEGAATLPTEQDDEPDLRRAEREAFCFAREEFRNQEKAEKDAKEAIESRAREEAKVVRAEKAVEIANRNAAKQNETAQKLMKRAAQAQIRAQLATANQNAKTQRNTQIKKQRADAVAELNKAEARLNKPESKPAGDKAAATTLPNLKDVTKHTPDPRAYLSLHDLTTMCAERGFDTTHKAKADLIQQLRDTDDEWSKEDLAKMCRAKTLSSNGTKAQLKYRMALAAAKDYPSFMPGLAAAKVDEDMDVDME